MREMGHLTITFVTFYECLAKFEILLFQFLLFDYINEKHEDIILVS